MSWYHVWCEIVLHLARLWVGFPGWSTTNMEYCKDFATEPMNDIKQIGSIFFFLLDLWSWTFCHVDISSTMDLELLFLAESKNTCHVLVDNPTIGRSFFSDKIIRRQDRCRVSNSCYSKSQYFSGWSPSFMRVLGYALHLLGPRFLNTCLSDIVETQNGSPSNFSAECASRWESKLLMPCRSEMLKHKTPIHNSWCSWRSPIHMGIHIYIYSACVSQRPMLSDKNPCCSCTKTKILASEAPA